MKHQRISMFIMLLCLLPLAAMAEPAAKSKVVKVKVTASSEAPNYEAYRAMDGNPATMWHTLFGSIVPKHPHEITVDLGKSYPVSAITSLPREAGGNGTIGKYEIYAGNDLKQLGDPVATGTFAKKDARNVVELLFPVTARYVKVRALSEVSNQPYASIAELGILSDGVTFVASQTPTPIFVDLGRPLNELEMQFQTLTQDLGRRGRFASYAEETYNAESLVKDSDRDPADIVLRRTASLLADISTMDNAPDTDKFARVLTRLNERNDNVDIDDFDARYKLYEAACTLRREIAFANPLLNFDEILFLKRHRSGFNHMCDQYYGINTKPGGSLFVLSDPFGAEPTERDIFANSKVESGRLAGQKLENGSFLSPDLSYDGKKLMFAYVECTGTTKQDLHVDPTRGHWDQGRSYHLFSANVDGTNLRQLTDGTFNDFDPCWLPNGRVVFISERRGGYLRCGRECPTYTLYDMLPDGSDMQMMSPHETNEWHPSVTNDGMIIYTRWDYIDRHGCVAHMPWTTTIDGRDARAVHGNFALRETRPDMELDVRAIPGSGRFVATAAPHHGQAFGSLVIIDPKVEDSTSMAPIKRLTPDVAFPESQGGAQVYGTPWPLSEKYYLAVYDAAMAPGAGRQGSNYIPGNYGIYLVDVFGNKELIHRDPTIGIQNPIPLRAHKAPPVMPEASERKGKDSPKEGILALINVYDSVKDWPEGTDIKALRIYQVLPMTVPSGNPPHEVGMRLPGLEGSDSVILARNVLGTVPVEKDGSAHFIAPAMKELYFQALDKDGIAVQSMRSAAYLQPGERLVCQGCHEPRHRAPQAPGKLALALKRAPSKITPDVDGTIPFSYPRLVQPVLDKNCLPCHQKNADKAPDLSSKIVAQGNRKWYQSYWSLAPKYGFWEYHDRVVTTPNQSGANASKLYPMLKKGHNDLNLSKEDMHRITLWLDSSSIFYGVYEKEGGEAQLRGEIAKPTLE